MGRTQRKRKKKHSNPESSDLSKLLNLQRSLRIKCPNLKIRYFNELGWGIRGKKNIEEGEVLIALPLHHLITPDVPCDIFSAVNIKKESAQFILTIVLIYELHLGKKSKHLAYIESLPKTFTNPYFCTTDEINLLPNFIQKEVLAQIHHIKNKFKEIHEIINEKYCPHCGCLLKNIFTEKIFSWAWFCVNTRSVFYQNTNHTPSMALAPFLDLFNHSNNAVTKQYIDFENGLYILKSQTSFKKYDQIFIKYGTHHNLKLFLEYGFVLDDCSNDLVEFSFEEVLNSVKEFDPSFSEIPKLKYKFIKSNKLDTNLFKSCEFSWNFKGLIYVLITNDEDISFLQAKTYSNLFTVSEMNAIEQISKIAAEKKIRELKECLLRMETVRNCSGSFQIAKSLVKMHINLLE